jgi:ribonuclease HI
MGKQKFYVVWVGREIGVFETWEMCNAQIFGYPKGIYKSFSTRAEAENAFLNPSLDYVGKGEIISELTEEQKIVIGKPILESISVDGAWNTVTGIVEYRGVHTATKKEIFRLGPFEDGTNNIVEFLSIVHALAYCKKNEIFVPVYSDSRTGISWVRDKEHRTNREKSKKNEKLFELLERATKWLRENEYNNRVLKWETKAWGENPADFGRK